MKLYNNSNNNTTNNDDTNRNYFHNFHNYNRIGIGL